MLDEILNYIKNNENASSLEFSNLNNYDHQKVVSVLKTLESENKVCSTVESINRLELSLEGHHITKNGSHEYQIYKAIPPEGILKENLIKTKEDNIGFTKAMSNKWIKIIDKDGNKVIIRSCDTVTDKVYEDLQNLENINPDSLKEYKKRKLVKEVTVKYFIMTKGPKFSESGKKEIALIDKEYLKSCKADFDLENTVFKPFNVQGGTINSNANLHPLLKMRSEYCRILNEMGMKAMPTNNYVESSFWNFDALFQPQDHAARDAHDTFFVSEPRLSCKLPLEYLHRVEQVHSNGGYGSQGYKHPWRLEEAQKNLLRTHTTAVSARMLYLLAQKKEFEPVGYYSIDRVFRNESLDATHLAEFHQVEGLIADRNIGLGTLKSVIRTFFRKLGIEKIRFKPAFNPYTEPSMEIYGFHEGMNKWIEIGNSGMFRPEMLLPMGLPEDVNVIAWGLSLERPMMINYEINDIRDMLGPKLNLDKVYANPICRLGH